MKLSIDFNWPKSNSAHVSIGMPNIKDKEWDFRIGIVQKDKSDIICWIKPGWFSGDEMEKEITLDVKRGDKVVVERKKKGAEKTETRNTWDIDKEWPLEAHGASMTNIPWYF